MNWPRRSVNCVTPSVPCAPSPSAWMPTPAATCWAVTRTRNSPHEACPSCIEPTYPGCRPGLEQRLLDPAPGGPGGCLSPADGTEQCSGAQQPAGQLVVAHCQADCQRRLEQPEYRRGAPGRPDQPLQGLTLERSSTGVAAQPDPRRLPARRPGAPAEHR